MSEPSVITGLPAPQVAIHAGDAGDPFLHREAVAAQDSHQIARAFRLLESQPP